MADTLPYAYVKDIKPAQKNLNVIFIVLEVGTPTRTKDNHTVRSCKVADKTGCINISIWDEIGELVTTGDICRLVKGYTNIFKNCLTLYAGKSGGISKIGEFCMQFTESPNMSEANPDLVIQQAQNKADQQRKSPTELDSAGTPLAQMNNPGGRGSPPVRQNSGQQGNRSMGNGQNFNSGRPRGQGQRSNFGPNRNQQQFQGNGPQGRAGGQNRMQSNQNTQNRNIRR